MPKDFLAWARKQLAQAGQVHSCYEAGPLGYGLHRALTALGIRNVIVRPQNWDELGKGVKTDRTDALALVQRLDRYVQGNRKALAVVCVPTPEQELARSQSRQREQLLAHRLRFESSRPEPAVVQRRAGAGTLVVTAAVGATDRANFLRFAGTADGHAQFVAGGADATGRGHAAVATSPDRPTQRCGRADQPGADARDCWTGGGLRIGGRWPV